MSALINKDGTLLPVDFYRMDFDQFQQSKTFCGNISPLDCITKPTRPENRSLQPNDVYSTDIIIPAYTFNGQGLAICFKLYAHLHMTSNRMLETQGQAAASLRQNFLRTLTILSSLQTSWKRLLGFKFQLITCSDQYVVKDARSAGLPLAIALLNILRVSEGLHAVDSVVGSGILRIDGSFDTASGESQKRAALAEMYPGKIFLDPAHCGHVLDLHRLFHQY